MLKQRLLGFSFLFSAAAVAVIISGCGGGGGSSSGPPINTPPVGQTMTFGGLTANVAGTLQPPVTAGGAHSTITGVAGANITSLALAQTPKVGNSFLAFSRNGITYIERADRDFQYYLTTEIPTVSASTSPSWGPGGKDLVIQRYDTTIGRFQIYDVLADGSNLRKVTNGAFDDYTPAYAPSGARIAFVRAASGIDQIYTVPPGGGTATKISDGTSNDFQPAWSPNGSQIAFTRAVNGHYQIFIMSSTGANPHILSTTFAGHEMQNPSWSPDGTKIAFDYNSGSYSSIIVISADGITSRQLSVGNKYDTHPTWSPDGLSIAFSRSDMLGSDTSIYTMSAIDGSYPSTESTPPAGISDSSPSWSPSIASRPLIGPGGSLGASAGGFIFSQNGTTMPSIVTFDSGTRTGLTVSSQNGINSGLSTIVFLVSSTVSLTSLAYKNNLNGAITTVIGTGGISATTASDALVSFDEYTGIVSSVLPYTAAHAVEAGNDKPGLLKPSIQDNVLIYHAHFLGAWNASGKNIAPSGGSEARIDARTGALISIN